MYDESKLWMIVDRLGRLQVGETFSSSAEDIIPHRSWSTSFWRAYQGENRRQTITYINSVLQAALDLFELQPQEEIMHRLLRAVQGLAQLQFTYANDEILGEEIRVRCQEYTEKIILLWENNRRDRSFKELAIAQSMSELYPSESDNEESESVSNEETESDESEPSEPEPNASSIDISAIDVSSFNSDDEVKKEPVQPSPRPCTQPMEIPPSTCSPWSELARIRLML